MADKVYETFFQPKDNDVKQIGLELYNLSNYVTHENYAGLSKLINVDQKTVESIDNMKVINLNKNENDHFFRSIYTLKIKLTLTEL